MFKSEEILVCFVYLCLCKYRVGRFGMFKSEEILVCFVYLLYFVNIEWGDLVCFVYLQQSEEIWCVLYIYDSVSTAHVGRLFTVNRHNLE